MLETNYYYKNKDIDPGVLLDIASAIYGNSAVELIIQEPGGKELASTANKEEYGKIFVKGKVAVLRGKTANPGNLEIKLFHDTRASSSYLPEYSITVISDKGNEEERAILERVAKKLNLY